jgi:hypothetical protein
MPLVMLPPVATLVSDPLSRAVSELRYFGECASVGEQIAIHINRFSTVFASGFADVSEVVEALAAAAAVDEQWQQRRRELHLVTLAATGRIDEAAALLPAYVREHSVGQRGRQAQRFARQLSRRVESMPSPIPPAEQTIAMLPWSPGPRDPSTAAQLKRRRLAEALMLKEVRAHADGKSLCDLRERVREESERRGLNVTPILRARIADLTATETKWFGLIRSWVRVVADRALARIRLYWTALNGVPEEPQWMLPPHRATYRLPTSRDQAIEVRIDPGAHGLLEKVRATVRPRWPVTYLTVWLTRTVDVGDTTITVHVGEQRVGTLAQSDVAAYAEFFTAAALFDEDPVLRGALIHTVDGIDVLQIPRPDPARIVEDTTAEHLDWDDIINLMDDTGPIPPR